MYTPRWPWRAITALVGCVTLAFAQASSFRITTVAGSNSAGDGGVATAALLSAVEGLAADSAGNLYFADSTGHRVRRVDPSGRISTVAGNGSSGLRGDGGPAAQSVVNSPYGVAMDGAGNLYFADFGNRRVRRVQPDGVIRTVAGGGADRVNPGEGSDALGMQLQGPRNVAVDPAGNLYVSDYSDHRVYRIAATTGRVTVVAGTGAGGDNGDGPGISTQLNFPAGLAVERSTGALFIADSGNKRIRRVLNGDVTTVLGGPGSPVALGVPTGVALDRDGNLYVSDSGASRIFLRRASTGAVSTVAGASPALEGPVRDVTVDARGGVCFSNGRQVWKLSGSGMVVVAGSGDVPATPENVEAKSAALSSPMGVALDTAGNLYIAEERLARIRRVTLGGLLQTVAGGGLPVGNSLGDGGPALAARLIDPVAVAWDPVAGLRIADYQGNRIRGLLPNGNIFTVAGDGEPGFRGDGGPAAQARVNRPRAVAFDREGNLYIADSLNHRVRRITASGFISTVAGSGVRGYFGDGGAATQAQFNSPQGIAVDSLGNLYVADTGNHVVRRVAAQGGVVTTVAGRGVRGFGGDGAAAALAALNGPAAVAVDLEDRLLIADTFNHRIRRVNADGKIETIAGDGVGGWFGDDGPALAAQLNSPAGLAVGPNGEIYVADLDNQRVRRLVPVSAPGPVTPPGEVTAPAADVVVMNAASLRSGPVAPGMIASVFGAGIGPDRALAVTELPGGRLPFALGGVEVRIDGQVCALFYAGPDQLNVEVPRLLPAPKQGLTVEVWRAGKLIGAGRVDSAPVQPALFTTQNGVGQAAVVAVGRPTRGGIVTLYATGDGPSLPVGLDGTPAGFSPVPLTSSPVQVLVGNAEAEVLFAGRAPGFVGLMQVNVRLPGIFTPPGERALTLVVGGVRSQPGVTITVD